MKRVKVGTALVTLLLLYVFIGYCNSLPSGGCYGCFSPESIKTCVSVDTHNNLNLGYTYIIFN